METCVATNRIVRSCFEHRIDYFERHITATNRRRCPLFGVCMRHVRHIAYDDDDDDDASANKEVT
jgi:hypothetical protein